MKPMIQTLILSAAMTVGAFAESGKADFEVNFPFSVDKQVMPAGKYVIQRVSDQAPVLSIRTADGKKGLLIHFSVKGQAAPSETQESIEFACSESNCRIARVNNLTQGTVYFSYRGKESWSKLLSVNLNAAKATAE